MGENAYQLISNLGFAIFSAVAIGYAFWKVMNRFVEAHFALVEAFRAHMPLQTDAVRSIKDAVERLEKAISNWPSDPNTICQIEEMKKTLEKSGLTGCQAHEMVAMVVERVRRSKETKKPSDDPGG